MGFFPGFDQGTVGGITLGIYAWDAGEQIAQRMGAIDEDDRTLLHLYRPEGERADPKIGKWSPDWRSQKSGPVMETIGLSDNRMFAGLLEPPRAAILAVKENLRMLKSR